MSDLSTLPASARALESLRLSVVNLTEIEEERRWIADARERGHFTPSEEEALIGWFARFLTVRSALWDLIGEAAAALPGGDLAAVETREDWRWFLIGYSAACLVVRLDRFLVEDVARDRWTRRKLNEGSPAHRIPRKQWTAVFESLAHVGKARAMERALRFAREHGSRLAELLRDPVVGSAAGEIAWLEEALDPSHRRFLRLHWRYRIHSLRRRGARARQRTVFAALEAGGRLASEIRRPAATRRIGAEVVAGLREILRPGDVLVTRRDGAFTNLFLPGYWPHAALYVGTEANRDDLGLVLDDERARRWADDRCVLEALKDGVRFRPLEETLEVDAVAVVRPRLPDDVLASALARACAHEGKGYDFDFDFFRSDRLVCTEVVYRAYDGLGPIRLRLRERAGRPTLSAEDLLDAALERVGFEVLAVAVGPGAPRLVEGPDASSTLAATYR